jgi:hypothetical protein
MPYLLRLWKNMASVNQTLANLIIEVFGMFPYRVFEDGQKVPRSVAPFADH